MNMALEPGAYRELHWHKEAEWGLMLVGNARVTCQDEKGRYFIDDVVRGGAAPLDPGARSGMRVSPSVLRT